MSFEESLHASGIASSFFHIISLCACIPALICSLRALYLCRKDGGRISVFVIVLLLTDVIQSFLSPPEIMYNLNKSCISLACSRIRSFFEMSEYCGLYLHQLVALECTLYLKYPLFTAHLFSLPCSLTLSAFLYLFIVLVFFSKEIFVPLTGFSVPSICTLIVTFTFTCKASSSSDHGSVSNQKTKQWVLAIAMATVIVLYLPYFLSTFILDIYQYVNGYSQSLPLIWDALTVTFSLMSLRVIMDGVLCVLVCRQYRILQTHSTLTTLPGTEPLEPSKSH